MYQLVGMYPDSRRLADLASRLGPQPCREGYCTTDRAATRALYESHLREVFLGEWTNCLLSIIWQNGSIYPHCDGEARGARRFHLVLQSNKDCWNMHGNEWQQLQEGGIYMMNPLIVHASINWGQEPRIHFVVDVKVTGEVTA